MTRLSIASISLAVAGLLSACGGGGDAPPPARATVGDSAMPFTASLDPFAAKQRADATAPDDHPGPADNMPERTGPDPTW